MPTPPASTPPVSTPPADPLSPRQAMWAGILTSLPLMMGVISFSVICGASASGIGLSFAQAWGLSWIVFAGSSQIVFTQLMGNGAAGWVVVLTGWVVNLRFLMYSATLAPHFRNTPRLARWFGAYLLVDQSFATTLERILEGRSERENVWFYAGISLALWVSWQAGSIAGILLGSFIPASWSMDFLVALNFIALLIPLLGNPLAPMARVAAAIGALVALAPALPFKLNLLVAALAGAGVATLLEKLWKPATSGPPS